MLNQEQLEQMRMEDDGCPPIPSDEDAYLDYLFDQLKWENMATPFGREMGWY